MVDRYLSIIDDPTFLQRKSSIQTKKTQKIYENLMIQTNESADKMKKIIKQYRFATTSSQQQQITQKFVKEQQKLKQFRQQLAIEFKKAQKDSKNRQKLLIKQYLFQNVQKQLNLNIQMNEIISNKQHQLEIKAKKMIPGSEQLRNAWNDINEKRDQILYLQQQTKQCVQLLEIIGVLAHENSQKIDEALNHVKKANLEVDKSQKIIQIVQKKDRDCCLI